MSTREDIRNLRRTAQDAESNSLEALKQIGDLADVFDELFETKGEIEHIVAQELKGKIKLRCYELATQGSTDQYTLNEAKELYAWATESEGDNNESEN